MEGIGGGVINHFASLSHRIMDCRKVTENYWGFKD